MRNFARTLAPEKLIVRVVVEADGGYSHCFEGVLAFAPAIEEGASLAFDARLEARLEKAAQFLRREGFRDVRYCGRGRYAVVSERVCVKRGGALLPAPDMRFVAVRPQGDGRIVIGSARPDLATFTRFPPDAELDGALQVKIDPSVKVLQHNSPFDTVEDGAFSVYRWRLSPTLEDPLMIALPPRAN